MIPAIIGIITTNGFRISHNKTFYQTKDPKVTQVIVKNNCLCLDTYYKHRIDSFDEVERTSNKGIGTVNYFERVRKIGKTKKKKIFKHMPTQ